MYFLRINNFKCFQEIDIHLNRLTLMAGANGNGKSTTIQALLFLRQTIEENFRLFEDYYVSERPDININVPLNASFLLTLGNSAHLINRTSDKNEIQIGIFSEEKEMIVDYVADNLEPKLFLTAVKQTDYSAATMPILKKEFYYLNAERIGPRVSQSIQFFDYPNAGWQGEFVAQLISERSGYLPVEKERLFGNTTNPGLEFQVNEWLNDIMPGVRITAKQNADTFTSQIQVENIYTKGDPTIATNIGFGISYILPIIATGLVAKKESYFIVENPEAHLHPSAQSKIGKFLAMVANAGVHVIIETHSDHIINGLQIAVAKSDLQHQFLTINYFSDKDGNIQPDVLPITISEKGELTEWPKGFFDQMQIDYATLFKLRMG
ncbi:AAA family ATPase [Chitinophaga japonensis]|uniref:Putative ATPase n=1 Tax=Chitinophaga japonensis TaxID=104662 RepID=A0A562T8X4_CHIJA|nr:DUF3696 domain-containing protein [Chitinophaga japonensis]TWI89270.1 putative ATPase [Chitinophaga japonensis]